MGFPGYAAGLNIEQNAAARKQQTADQQRSLELENLAQSGLSPQDMQRAIALEYQRDPNKVKQWVQGLIAKATVRKVFNRYQAAARAIAEDQEPEKLADADVMSAALHQYSDGALENIAREAANQAFQGGRAQGLQNIEDETGQDLVWRRGSVLEDSTCSNCAEADGSIIDGPDEDLSTICDGGNLCKCLQYANLDE